MEADARRAELLRRLDRQVGQAGASRLRKLLRHPAREARFRLVWRLGLPQQVVVASLFSGQELRVVLPEKVAIEIYRHGLYEPDLTRVLLTRLRSGMSFVDIGSLYGYHALVAAGVVGAGGQVTAFEPSRRSFELLRDNLSGERNARVENLAVFSGPGKTVIRDFGPRNSALNTLLGEARIPEADRGSLRSEEYQVECVALDDYFRGADRQPDVVKIDAESVELDVLRGMEGLLRGRRLELAVEVGDYGVGSGSSTGAELIAYLDGLGYACFEFGGGELRPHRVRDRYEYDNLYFLKRAA